MSKPMHVRLDDDNDWLDAEKDKRAIINVALRLYKKYENGEIRESGEAPTESEEQLIKRKLGLECDIAKLKLDAMEAKTVIDQAANIKVELLKEVLEHRRLKNRELRARLDGVPPATQTHQELAHDASKGTIQVSTWKCTNGCGATLRWPTPQERKKNGSNRPIELGPMGVEMVHWCQNYKKQNNATSKTAPANEPKSLVVGCSEPECNFRVDLDHYADSAKPFQDMNDWMRNHVKRKHDRQQTESEDVIRRAIAEGFTV